ncbi:YgiQ family radical SAM protein [Christensenellaceae bacterium OttesenSCG-928-K19]|nr:YgiQ family radical SAM protein [Christensenellaceae bacterium OttesenSCG-928-K19]
MQGFLPVNKKDMREQDIEQLDFVLVTGDAYVDHPSFAHAVISRYLVGHGYSVGILAQPNWKTGDAFKALGRPRLGFLISAGNMDSMVNLYTAAKKRRGRDLYSPGGKAGKRPARTTQVYAKKIREAYGDVPIIVGGIEASLRRFAHYDYWENKILPSILASSGADLLVYGMGERAIVEIAEALDGGLKVRDVTYVRGTVYKAENLERVYDYVELPGENKVNGEKHVFAEAFLTQMQNRRDVLVQQHKSCYIVQNPPANKLTQKELDFVYALPYQRRAHPAYTQPVPALDEVKFSITATRGCVGECAFCALYYHQGKELVWRSENSVLQEAEAFLADKEFKGYIHDVGGPTANLYGTKCTNPAGVCAKRRCLVPVPCKHLKEGQRAYVKLLGKLRGLQGVKKVFIRSGVRHDLALMDKSGLFIRELAKHHVSGQLKLAPEHASRRVTELMGKPPIERYEQFCRAFERESKKVGKKQHVLPYYMCAHPGCTLDDAIVLAEYMRDSGFCPEQAQEFYPTPGTLASCMYYTGLNPLTGREVFVEKSVEGKAMQRALMQYKNPGNAGMVGKALRKADREDLAANGKRGLLRGRKRQ